ncbi:polysaccharide lyase family 8 protein [Mycena rebaudengoi]|nr:polysaccharide lyase family 8 protein [Mycena rebaudengoi]
MQSSSCMIFKAKDSTRTTHIINSYFALATMKRFFLVSSNILSLLLPTLLGTTAVIALSPTRHIHAARDTAQELDIIRERRFSTIVGSLQTQGGSIGSFIATLQSNGQWPDVNYATGCDAQRANWPAQIHWNKISAMAAAWHGGLTGAEKYVQDPALRANISLAMNYWFSNDFTNPACIDSGGTSTCPCGTPGLWNTNWYGNTIGTPLLAAMSCLLLDDSLTEDEVTGCTKITGRGYETFTSKPTFLTGANTLDVAKIGIDQALFTNNVSLITDAYRRIHAELVIFGGVRADGIKPDGSFSQHTGILYNGNYGKDYTNDAIDLEIAASGTQFEATPASQEALATLFDGDRWMIYRNTLTGTLHWDFSALGRFIAFPVIDNQATANIKLNLTSIGALGKAWNSAALSDFASTLSGNGTHVNDGPLVGQKMFYSNDYAVHRGSGYITSLKMYSSRTTNTECTNLANPLGFHLSDGALRTYIRGDEYEDIAASMDWYLVPGITVIPGATPLNCAQTGAKGVENFVGGATVDGQLGVAAMRYSNPLTHDLSFQKAWFFLDDDVQLVMVANISSASNATVVSVLDQKRHAGIVRVDGLAKTIQPLIKEHGLPAQSLWHDNLAKKTGNWTSIGTSTQPPQTVDIFTAWIQHNSRKASLAYTIFPGTDYDAFVQKSVRSQKQIQVVQNDGLVSAAFDHGDLTFMAVFWAVGGGSVSVSANSPAGFTLSTTGAIALIYEQGVVTVSDPSQLLTTVSVTLTRGAGGSNKTLVFTLPSGDLAGSSVSQTV